MVFICTEPDLYTAGLFEKGTVWVSTLSDGSVVYQDDEREGVDPESAWERLGIHCQEAGVHVVDMYIQNGTNKAEIGKDCDGYYFCKGAGGFLYGGGLTHHTYICGVLKEDILLITAYNVPELTIQFTETRDPNENNICLIARQGVLSDEKKK